MIIWQGTSHGVRQLWALNMRHRETTHMQNTIYDSPLAWVYSTDHGLEGNFLEFLLFPSFNCFSPWEPKSMLLSFINQLTLCNEMIVHQEKIAKVLWCRSYTRVVSPLSSSQSNLIPNGRGMPQSSGQHLPTFFGQIQGPKAEQEKMNLEQRKNTFEGIRLWILGPTS